VALKLISAARLEKAKTRFCRKRLILRSGLFSLNSHRIKASSPQPPRVMIRAPVIRGKRENPDMIATRVRL